MSVPAALSQVVCIITNKRHSNTSLVFLRRRSCPKRNGDSLVCHLRDVGAGWTERCSAHPRGNAATAGTSRSGLVPGVQVRFTRVCVGDEDSGCLCPL